LYCNLSEYGKYLSNNPLFWLNNKENEI